MAKMISLDQRTRLAQPSPDGTLGHRGCDEPAAFDRTIQTQLVPTLQPGDVVILDNLSVHKSAQARAAIRACGARMLFLPQYSPDLIRSRWRSPSLRQTCAPPRQERPTP